MIGTTALESIYAQYISSKPYQTRELCTELIIVPTKAVVKHKKLFF